MFWLIAFHFVKIQIFHRIYLRIVLSVNQLCRQPPLPEATSSSKLVSLVWQDKLMETDLLLIFIRGNFSSDALFRSWWTRSCRPSEKELSSNVDLCRSRLYRIRAGLTASDRTVLDPSFLVAVVRVARRRQICSSASLRSLSIRHPTVMERWCWCLSILLLWGGDHVAAHSFFDCEGEMEWSPKHSPTMRTKSEPKLKLEPIPGREAELVPERIFGYYHGSPRWTSLQVIFFWTKPAW